MHLAPGVTASYNTLAEHRGRTVSDTFKPGDKLKCVKPNTGLVLGNVYTFSHYDHASITSQHKIVYVNEVCNTGFYDYRFELFSKTTILNAETASLIRKLIKVVYDTTNSNSELEDAKKILAWLDEQK